MAVGQVIRRFDICVFIEILYVQFHADNLLYREDKGKTPIFRVVSNEVMNYEGEMDL
jgi:hypothetical protein